MDCTISLEFGLFAHPTRNSILKKKEKKKEKKKKTRNRLIIGNGPILLNNTILKLICYLVYISKVFGDTGDEFF